MDAEVDAGTRLIPCLGEERFAVLTFGADDVILVLTGSRSLVTTFGSKGSAYNNIESFNIRSHR